MHASWSLIGHTIAKHELCPVLRHAPTKTMVDKDLTLLGRRAAIPASPAQAVLERIPNDHVARDYLVRFTCSEFTSPCPVTGQPDFAHIVIDYVPDRWLVESKALKLYLHRFRNEASFH